MYLIHQAIIVIMISAVFLIVLFCCFKYVCHRHQRNRGQVSDIEDPNKYGNRMMIPQSHQGIYTLYDSSTNDSELPTYNQIINARTGQHRSNNESLELERRPETTQSFQLRTINVHQREQDEQEQPEQESLFM